jgi:hypothetical protein
MTKRSLKAFACVGTHGLPYCCQISSDPRLNGRYEIFDNYSDARKMALSVKNIRRVRIILGEFVEPPLGKSGDAK